MSIIVKTGRDASLPDANAARVHWYGGRRGDTTVKPRQEFEIERTNRLAKEAVTRVRVTRLNARALVTIHNDTTQKWSTEVSVAGEPALDDILKAGASMTLAPYASVELRR